MGKELYTAKQFIEAIPGTGGIVSTIADRVGCRWETAHKYITKYATVQQAYQDECERINDLAQSTVLKSIRDGNTADAKWWLTKKRKAEFGDAVDVTSGGEPLTIKWVEIEGDQSG